MPASFLYTNKLLSVGGTLTPSSENTSYPRANLIDENGAKPWRTANVSTSHTMVNDFGSAQTIDTCCIVNPNYTSAAIIRIQGHTADSWGAPDVNEVITVSGFGTDPPFYNIFHKLASSQSKRYWRLFIDNTTNPDGFYETGEWLLGVRVTVATGQDPEIGFTETYPDPNVLHQTEYLHDYAYIRDLDDVRNMQLEWKDITLATLTQLRVLKRAAKNSGHPFVFTMDHTASPAESFYVRMIGDLEVIRSGVRTYTVRMFLREQARGASLPTG